MLQRPRRMRKMEGLRKLARETVVTVDDLIYPLFVVEGTGIKEEIKTMPGCYHFSIDCLLEEIEELSKLGLNGILLFGIPGIKDEVGSEAWSEEGIVQKAVRSVKKNYPEMVVITDICLCGYTTHGHCGVIKNGMVDNDRTLVSLKRIALSHARAGADLVAPSDMMDGRVLAIREALDEAGYQETGIMSYSVKYASGFYGPFREAAHSAPQFGDRSSYQMDYTSSREALKEVKLDLAEGADIVMVKPALSYLDIIYQLKQKTDHAVAAYSVSGEYAMVKQAARAGLCREEQLMREILTSIKRAGADIIITYYAKEFAYQYSQYK